MKGIGRVIFGSAAILVAGLYVQGSALAHSHSAGNTYAGYTRIIRTATVADSAPAAPNESITSSLSKNWSGYAATGGQYTEVMATWNVPNVAASNSLTADATWIGIGGVTNSDLIQAGTQEISENGQVRYQAWYETLPDASTPVSLQVSPGDSITAVISETAPDVWLVAITDNTTGKTYSTSVNYQSSQSSVEWIEEMPSDVSGAFVPLDNFGSVSFTGAQAISNNQVLTLSSANAVPLTMEAGGVAIATPSSLSGDGQGFTVTRSSTQIVTTPQRVQMQESYPGAFRRRGHPVQEITVPTSTFTPTSSSSSEGYTQTFTTGPFTIRVTFF